MTTIDDFLDEIEWNRINFEIGGERKRIEIREHLEYLEKNFPNFFNQKMFSENVKTMLDARLEVFGVDTNNLKLIGSIWQGLTRSYLICLKCIIEELQEEGHIGYSLKEITSEQAYQDALRMSKIPKQEVYHSN